MKLTTILSKNYINFRGWSARRKIIIIESDDWGSIRASSRNVVEKMTERYPHLKSSKFFSNDGLERTADLEVLFETLTKYRDYNGNSPVITALALTANPDFDAISASGEFRSESIVKTYTDYGEGGLMDFWKSQGIGQNLLYPQFHGKEHLFPERYMKRIANVNDVEHVAFNNRSLYGGDNTTRDTNFMAAFEYHNDEDKVAIEKRTAEGLEEFRDLFGFRSKSFCPSQSVYGNHIFPVLKDNGVTAIQAGQQLIPEDLKLRTVNHYWGNHTDNGLVFWRRNCTFEPYKSSSADHVDQCLREIEIAFRWGKPAVINSHRINFTSRIRTDIRDRTLTDLDRLLKTIIAKWPDAEFMNSEQLADIMTKAK